MSIDRRGFLKGLAAAPAVALVPLLPKAGPEAIKQIVGFDWVHERWLSFPEDRLVPINGWEDVGGWADHERRIVWCAYEPDRASEGE
jgi:hypothetical protein